MAAAAVVAAAAGRAARASLIASIRPGSLRAFLFPRFLPPAGLPALISTLVPALLLALPLRAASIAPVGLTPAGEACADLERLMASFPGDGPVLLLSYPAAPPGPLAQAAFVYDNAVAAIALIGCGQLPLALRLGEALRIAATRDRFWHDGRVRNAYAAGAIEIGAADDTQPLKLAGWWDRAQGRWLEDSYQAGTDSGNMAWTLLALLALDDALPVSGGSAHATRPFLRAALRLGAWLEIQRDRRGAGGFTGGASGHEPQPPSMRWKSTEHNADLVAAFQHLARATGDPHWSELAAAAAGFVASMWDADCRCFAAGTLEDGRTPNPLLALDAQIWPLLALPQGWSRYGAALVTAQARLRAGPGYSYSSAGGGPWIEGSAQVLLLLALLHRDGQTDALRALLATARVPGAGYYATSTGTVPTGFARDYPHLLHLGATAWAALAQQGFNPFTAGRSLPP